jgi:hypothetical protein
MSILQAAQSFSKPSGNKHPSRFFADAKVLVDQTKKDNSSAGEQDPAHKEQTARTDWSKSADSHPAKQPDPQAPPTRSTGIEPEGPDGKAPPKK